MFIYYFLLGVFSLVFFDLSLHEIYTYSSLYFDRDTKCIEQFRTLQKKTDIICIIHYIVVSLFSFYIIYFSICNLKNVVFDFTKYNVVSFIFLTINIFFTFIVIKKYDLKTVRDNIMKQWKNQKVVTKDNDHEVNLYRACNTIVDNYNKHNLIMFIVLLMIILL